jgi:hypothetical protein
MLSPALPAPKEANAIIATVGQRMSQFGSNYTAPFYARAGQIAMQYAPIMDLLTKGQFSQQMFRSREQSLRLMEEERDNAMQEALMRHHQQILTIQEIIKRHDLGGYGFGEAGDKAAMDDLETALRQTGHEKLLSTLHNGGIPALADYLQWEDQNWQDAYAAHVSNRKARDKGITNDEYGAGGGQREGATPQRPQYTPLAKPGELTAVPQNQAELDAALNQRGTLGPTGVMAAKAIGRGDPGAEDTAKSHTPEITNALDAGKQRYRNIISQITSGPGTAQEKLNQLRAIGENGLADDIANFGNFGENFARLGFKREGLYRPWVEGVFGAGWKPGNWNAVEKFNLPTSDTYKLMSKFNSFTQDMIQLHATLKDQPGGEDTNYATQWIIDALQGKAAGDVTFQPLHQQLQTIAQDLSSIQAGTSAVRVSLVIQRLHDLGPYATPRQIRAAFLPELADVYSRFTGYQHQWEQITGRKGELVPGVTPESFNRLGDLLRENPYTGAQAEDAADEVQAIRIEPDQLSKSLQADLHRRGLDWAPLTRDKWREYNQAVKDFDASTDPAIRNNPEIKQKVQEMRIRLGTTIMPPTVRLLEPGLTVAPQ